MNTFRLNLPEEISIDSVSTFLLDLQRQDLLYHIDDDPFEVFTGDTRTFSTSECYALIGFWNAAEKKLGWARIWNDCFPPISLD